MIALVRTYLEDFRGTVEVTSVKTFSSIKEAEIARDELIEKDKEQTYQDDPTHDSWADPVTVSEKETQVYESHVTEVNFGDGDFVWYTIITLR